MLYIFHVDTGTTITFDMKLALESVAQLKEAIERECGVAAGQQVLLVSGGESLEPNARVCSYSAGTDTNPIYLFSKTSIESHQPPTPSIDYGSDVDLQGQIDASLAMPATYQTVVARAQLAQQCCALAREQTRICERLVHDQHLQQQGWAAVVANLEDITQMFQSRADMLQQSFTHYLAERKEHIELLNNFNSDLGMLSKIPILPALRAHAEGLLSPEDQPSVEQTEENSDEVLSLLKWISAKDNQSSLEQVAEQCSRGLEQFDERVMETLKSEVNASVEAANKQDMKEIKGLGERLFGLEQLMFETKRLVQEQGDLAQAFLQNQNRASNLGDASILPDLCASHRRQLMVMLQNHNQLRDIRRRCTKAKEELSVNLYHRLKWIMYVENKMMEVDGKLVMYHESLKRLRRHLEVLQQIHLAPQMYMSAVAEVVRRRTFSQSFLVWASHLACQLLTVHSEELARRRDFLSKFDGHFLNTLFPGLEDTPPPFATQAPSVFDGGLPKLTVDDMESLRNQLPDLALTTSSPDLNSITQFFLSKSLTEGSTEGNKEKEDQQMQDGTCKAQHRRRAPMLCDRAGFESETDTEEFEKIGQGPTDLKRNSFDGAKPQQHHIQLEENLGNTRGEVERLRALLRSMKCIASEALAAFRQELTTLREQTSSDKTGLKDLTEGIQMALEQHSRECMRSLREREQALTVDHELEMGDVKKLIQGREEELQTMKQTLREREAELAEHERLASALRQKMETDQAELRSLRTRVCFMEEALEAANVERETKLKDIHEAGLAEISSLTENLHQCQERIRQLEESLKNAKVEQQTAVKEATDRLQMECKIELESIRSRFKLMAASSMERSPSDSSLEKIERPDLIELVNHEAILTKMKEDLEAKNAAKMRSVIDKERAECAAKLDHELRLSRQRNDAERQVWFNEAMRRVLEEKEKQVETHRARESVLTEECDRYRETIRRLTESESLVRHTLNEQVENLETDKARLEVDMMVDRKMFEECEAQLRKLEAERDELREELQLAAAAETERMEAIKARSDLLLQEVEADMETLKAELKTHWKSSEVDVSESKKVRLEANGDLAELSRKMEILECENKKLGSELRMARESTECAKAKIDALQSDKVRLEMELVKERSRRGFAGETSNAAAEARDRDMSASVAVVPESSSRDVATSPEPCRRDASGTHLRERLTRSTASLVQQGRVCIASCHPSDVVLVLWDPQHRNYTILQESSTLYFLHSECVDALDLRPHSDGTPKRTYAIAEVIDKEYCHARKSENRYRVPQGTKFYRVRVKALQKESQIGAASSSQQHASH